MSQDVSACRVAGKLQKPDVAEYSQWFEPKLFVESTNIRAAWHASRHCSPLAWSKRPVGSGGARRGRKLPFRFECVPRFKCASVLLFEAAEAELRYKCGIENL